MSKLLEKNCFVKRDEQYIVIGFFGHTMKLYRKSRISKIKQIVGKFIWKVKRKFNNEKSLVVFVPDFESRYGQYLLSNDITVPYMKLVRGLDNESIKLISLIINRFHQSLKKNCAMTRVNTLSHEQAEMSVIKENFHNLIVKCSKNVFAYKNYLLTANSFDDSVFFYKHGLLEISSNSLLNIKNKDIVDVGGFVGDSAIVFTGYTDKKVYSFEPSKININLMIKTIELNNVSNKVVPVNKGLGDKNEILKLNDTGNSEVGFFGQENEKAISIEVVTLDKFVEENNIEVGLIKVDIEGFEQNFLKGAIETIKKQKPVMLLSIYHNANDFFEIKPMIESWNLGYTFKIRKYCTQTVFTETMLICEPQ